MIGVPASNPFATKFVTAGRLDFVGLTDEKLDQIATTLIQQNGYGQIVGRHGVGKTTLTFELERRVARLCACDKAIQFFRKTVGPRGEIRTAKAANRAGVTGSVVGGNYLNDEKNPANRPAKVVLVLDGVDRLSWFQRLALIKSCQQKRIGLLITSHRRVWGLPVLVELESCFTQFKSVFETLTYGKQFQLSTERLHEIFTENDGDIREALMSCYDVFEASRASTAC